MKKITTFRENLGSLQNRYAQVSAENVALSERLAAQIADKQRILEHFSHYEGTHNCACRFPDDGDDPDGECGYHAALRVRLEAAENDLNLQVKDCIAAIAEAQRRGARLEAAERALTQIMDVGHDDDCILCGFKDRRVDMYFNAARGEPT